MPEYNLFGSILPGEDDFVDDSYTQAELERMKWSELRSVAAEHPCQEVNGQTEQSEIVETLTGKERV